MSDSTAPSAAAGAPVLQRFEFRGSAGEFFRIWIVNVALTLITLGIYSAWAKVRTRRYFYGNIFVAGNAFDYHASPLRILIGRLIALALFVGYNASTGISPFLSILWVVVFATAIPWLIVSSLRFNARNTSYRNVRFNFTGDYWGAFGIFIMLSIIAAITLGTLWPVVHREREYFYINNHTFGGKRFASAFSARSIYAIYLEALLIVIALGLGLAILVVFGGFSDLLRNLSLATRGAFGSIIGVTFLFAWIAAFAFIRTEVFNLAVSHTVLDGRHKLDATLSPWAMIWIGLSNLVLILLSIGLLYPWARVRVARYIADHMNLLAASNLEEFTSEAFATQSAIGEEIAGFFDFDIGL
jgi:uncharacterized membrane protein YjgN (DUF898 family)